MGDQDKTPGPERQRRIDEWWEVATPHMIGIAKAAGPAIVMFLLATLNHCSGKADTDQKVEHLERQGAPVINAHAAEIDELRKSLAEATDSIHVLQKVVLSGQAGFNQVGAPVKVAAVVVGQKPRRTHVVLPPSDPALVKQLQDNVAKNQKLQQRLEAKVPPSPTVPAVLPAVPVPAAEPWPPPVPVPAGGGGA